MALSAISSGVTGRCGLMEGVWIEPVMAQDMMTFFCMPQDRSLFDANA